MFRYPLVHRFRLGGLVLAASLLWSPLALAQERGVDRTAAARGLFQEGLELLDAEQWEEAADRFQRAMELRSTPQIVYNLTSALIPLGRLVSASELLRQLLRDDATSAEVRAAAEARLEELLPRLSSLTIRLAPNLDGAEVLIDGASLDPALIGVAAPVDPGSHNITARLGDVEATEGVTLEEGSAEELLLEASPDQAMSSASAQVDAGDGEPRSRPIVRRWWFWTIIGTVVIAGAVTGGVLGARAADEPPQPVAGLDATVHVGRAP